MAEGRKMAPARRSAQTDPGSRDQDSGVGWGGILVAVVGFTFVGYVFDAGGMRGALKTQFSGWSQTIHTHDGNVQRIYLAALPVVAGVLLLGLLYVLMMPTGRKKKTKSKAAAEPVVKPAAREVQAQGAVFVRPVRLPGTMPEAGVLLETKRPG